jgi:2-polyprenyl-3-methyl-5-hydroxy-6-metoxy-1,4-benzoquinol methylase
VRPDGERWNHNLHYHRLILDAVPAGARRALDVGCGEGILSRRLRERVPAVTGIDVDPASPPGARPASATSSTSWPTSRNGTARRRPST